MATKLLFRDKRSRLLLADIKSDRKISLLDYCSYVQWVPNSDVIVAQSIDQLCIWYQAENPDEMVMIPIKGEIETVLRDESRTEVIVEVNTIIIIIVVVVIVLFIKINNNWREEE
ncbi:unnamed protein product [Brugia pahangi]|uniref:VHL domain-containing protein n=1 Tax=Brugia pahangi TaxID=6280 RepID=A0A0N4TAT8_BRUPA|nr:unnamed protein product [Brugia pahangi]